VLRGRGAGDEGWAGGGGGLGARKEGWERVGGRKIGQRNGGLGKERGGNRGTRGRGWWIRVKEVRRVDGNRSCRACWGWRLLNEYRMDSMESKVLSAQDRTMEVYDPSSSYPSTCSSPARGVYLNRNTCSNRFAYHTNVSHAHPCSQEIEKETFKPATPSSPVLTRR